MYINLCSCNNCSNVIKDALRSQSPSASFCDSVTKKTFINPELTQNNSIFLVNNYLTQVKDNHYENAVKEAFVKLFGNETKKNASFGLCTISLPRDFGRDKQDFPDISKMEVKEAKKAISCYYAKNPEAKSWLEDAVLAFMNAMHLRTADMLYAILHFDETTPHVHIAFFLSSPLLDKNGTVKKSTEGNIIYENTINQIAFPFQMQFFPRLIETMRKRNMPYLDAMIAETGNQFNPNSKNPKVQSEEITYMIEDEIILAKVQKGLVIVQEALPLFHSTLNIVKAKNIALNKTKKDMALMEQKEKQLKTQFALDKMDISFQLDEAKEQITHMVRKAVEDYHIETIGLPGKEKEVKFTSMQNALLEQCQDILLPLSNLVTESKKQMIENLPK